MACDWRLGSRPSAISVTPPGRAMYFKLAATRGRRYTEMEAELWLQPVASRTTSIRKSGLMGWLEAVRGGHGRAMRNRPRSSRSECDSSFSWGRFGQLEPSMAAKSGSLPWVSAQRWRMRSSERLMALVGWWQVMQARPLEPSGVKKG